MARLVTLLVIFGLLLAGPATALAAPPSAGTVGGSCGRADLHAKLVGGGLVTFNCGVKTITFSAAETISANTTFDGGGLITIDGQEAARLFEVGAGVTLTLRHIFDIGFDKFHLRRLFLAVVRR